MFGEPAFPSDVRAVPPPLALRCGVRVSCWLLGPQIMVVSIRYLKCTVMIIVWNPEGKMRMC